MKKKNIRNIVGFCVLVPIITGVLVFLSVVATIGLDHLSIKWDIDNPHVDRHFSEWKKVSISGLDDFRIPEAWALKQEAENVYRIYDEAGQIWGTVLQACYYAACSVWSKAERQFECTQDIQAVVESGAIQLQRGEEVYVIKYEL